jgi:hypothetical protein
MTEPEREALLEVVIPFTLRQVEDLPLVFPTASVAILKSSSIAASASVHLTKREVAVLLSCSLYSMHAESKSGRFPTANFLDLLASCGHLAAAHTRANKRGDTAFDPSHHSAYNNVEKLRCLLFYFHTVAGRGAEEMEAVITFHRRSIGKRSEDVWMDALESQALLPPFELFSKGTIEDDLLPSPTLHLDFANKVRSTRLSYYPSSACHAMAH